MLSCVSLWRLDWVEILVLEINAAKKIKIFRSLVNLSFVDWISSNNWLRWCTLHFKFFKVQEGLRAWSVRFRIIIIIISNNFFHISVSSVIFGEKNSNTRVSDFVELQDCEWNISRRQSTIEPERITACIWRERSAGKFLLLQTS